MTDMIEQRAHFIRQLMRRGILRKDKNYYRFLTSPQLSIYQKSGTILFYSGAHVPGMEVNSYNHGIWTENGTKLGFYLDSLGANELFGTIHIPIDRLIRRNKFF